MTKKNSFIDKSYQDLILPMTHDRLINLVFIRLEEIVMNVNHDQKKKTCLIFIANYTYENNEWKQGLGFKKICFCDHFDSV